MSKASPALAALALALCAIAAFAAEAPRSDPAALLAQAKEATGGAAWDALRTQHSRVRITGGAGEGRVERWASILTGRSRMHLAFGNFRIVAGFDGLSSWVQQGGRTFVESDREPVQVAMNTAYRDRLAFWFPERHAAKMQYLGRETADARPFDVVAITPDGGRTYEAWIAADTHRIERLREPEGDKVRTEMYSDFRDVQGVKVPYVVEVSRGDPKHDESYAVELIEYNVPLAELVFEPPGK